MNSLQKIFLVLVITLMIAPSYLSQSVTKQLAALKGTIRFLTVDGAPLGRARVTLEGQGSTRVIDVTELMNGTYEFRVPPGVYHLTVTYPTLTKRAAIRLRDSTVVTVDLPVVFEMIVDRARPPNWKPQERLNKGVVDGEEEAFQETLIKVSADPSELMIRYGKWDESGALLKYEGAPVHFIADGREQDKFLPVMVSFNLLTIYANKVCYDPKTQRLTADGDLIIENGRKRDHFQHAEIDFSARNPMTTLITR